MIDVSKHFTLQYKFIEKKVLKNERKKTLTSRMCNVCIYAIIQCPTNDHCLGNIINTYTDLTRYTHSYNLSYVFNLMVKHTRDFADGDEK